MTEYFTKLRPIRKAQGKTQKDVADIIGVSERQYRSYETGEIDMPVLRLIAFCRYFGVSADYLLGLTDER